VEKKPAAAKNLMLETDIKTGYWMRNVGFQKAKGASQTYAKKLRITELCVGVWGLEII
jgi:hypothetical protein